MYFCKYKSSLALCDNRETLPVMKKFHSLYACGAKITCWQYCLGSRSCSKNADTNLVAPRASGIKAISLLPPAALSN